MKSEKIKRYEKYKDSGIPWIGEIPGHWEVKKLKYEFKEYIIKKYNNYQGVI